MSKRMDQLQCAWIEEAKAKADRYIKAKYTRKQRRWLPIIENFWQREYWEQERYFARIAPEAGKRIAKIDSDAWITKASQSLQKYMEVVR